MSIIKSSLVLRLLNKLDIPESSLLQAVKQSSLVGFFSNLLQNIREKLSKTTENSAFIKNIDNLILLTLSLSLVSIIFASTGIIGLLTAVSFLLIMAKFFCVKEKKHLVTSFDVPVFLYIAIAGLSVAFSSLFMPSLKGYAKMLIYFSGYLTFINVFKSHPKKIIYLMAILAITGSLEAIYAVYQQVVGVEPLAAWQDMTDVNPEQLMNRVYGTLKPFNPNLLAGYLVAVFSSAFGLGFWLLSRKKNVLSLVSFAGAMTILLALIFTGSRGAYMATFTMFCVFVPVSGHIIWHDYGHIKWLKKLWLAGIALSVVSVIIAILISPALQHRVLSIFALRDDSSNSYRLNVYASSIKMFLDNWITGIGPGNTTFRLIYGLYMITGYDALGAYSIPLEVAVELGIFGLLAFGWMIMLSFIKAAKYLVNNNSVSDKIIVSSCIIGITGLMTHGLVDTVWYRPQINLIFWMLIAILAIITSDVIKKR